MSARSFQLSYCLGIALSLASQSLGTAQTKVEEQRKTNNTIRCTIQVQDPVWMPTTPAIVRGKVVNLTEGALELSVWPILYLSSKTSNAMRDKYWGPVDLLRDSPLGLDKQPMDEKGEVVAIKALPIKLVFNSGAQSIDFRIDARHVLWDREISSVWPSRELFAAVDPGAYDLRLVLETDTGDSESANVTVQVGKHSPHESKH
jgi:hypothetical protein